MVEIDQHGIPAAIASIQSAKDVKVEDIDFASNLLKSNEFSAMLRVHDVLTSHYKDEPEAVTKTAVSDVAKAIASLEEIKGKNPDASALIKLLRGPVIQAALATHDRVANREFSEGKQERPVIGTPRGTRYFIPKVIQLTKGQNPLGMTIINEDGKFFIRRIIMGGVAAKSGLMNAGDQIMEVNGNNLSGMSPQKVVDILKSIVDGIVVFKLKPSLEYIPTVDDVSVKLSIRALFDQDTTTDAMIPVPEAGISFRRGDILHVISKDDPNWWQARKEGCDVIGIIPSKMLQEKRQRLSRHGISVYHAPETEEPKVLEKPRRRSTFRFSMRRKKSFVKSAIEQSNTITEIIETHTYEEVQLQVASKKCYPILMLVGPLGVGRISLKKKLVAEFPNKYGISVPHTTREKKPGEVEGREYKFISRERFQSDLKENKFVEHGEYSNNFYGTHIDSIKEVVNAGKVCILYGHPQAAKVLIESKVMRPFVVFVKPPPKEKLMASRSHLSGAQCDGMLLNASRMETSFGHLFTAIIENEVLDGAFEALKLLIKNSEDEPQWIPLGFH